LILPTGWKNIVSIGEDKIVSATSGGTQISGSRYAEPPLTANHADLWVPVFE
jgi:hypothetical protein